MFPTDVLASFHKREMEEALEKVTQYCNLMDKDPDEGRAEYKKLRATFEAAEAKKRLAERLRVLSKAINGTVILLAQENGGDVEEALIEYIKSEGVLTLEVVQDEDEGTQFVIRSKAHLAKDAVATSSQANRSTREGRRSSFRYFHRGEAINGALAKFLRDNYPTSRAVERLDEVDAKFNAGESKSKLGAWQAIIADRDLADLFDREKVA